MYDAGHISAVRRNFESRAMPEIEKPPARLVDIYYIALFKELVDSPQKRTEKTEEVSMIFL